MRVLTTMFAAACFAAACRGRETAEPAEAIATSDESAIEAVWAPNTPSVEHVQSVTTVERSATESSTSIELTLPAEPRTTPRASRVRIARSAAYSLRERSGTFTRRPKPSCCGAGPEKIFRSASEERSS